MPNRTAGAALVSKIFEVSGNNFVQIALEVFRHQAASNELYRDFCKALQVLPGDVRRIEDIPFLPISFFKSKRVVCGDFLPEIIFESSGTTGSRNSKHFVRDLDIYKKSFRLGYQHFYGPVTNQRILGLLPSYLERQHSSLVFMVEDLVKQSGDAGSGFYLNDFERLAKTITDSENCRRPTLLIGVTYALLDFADQFPMRLSYTTIMETGGMKGRREEMTREEVHEILKKRFGVTVIHSEYGMTELLSQAYSTGNGIFECPSWMKVLLRAEDDPFQVTSAANLTGTHSSGVVNVIDLANIHSCSFIATDDVGKLHADGKFEILGRVDRADLRGCSLLYGG